MVKKHLQKKNFQKCLFLGFSTLSRFLFRKTRLFKKTSPSSASILETRDRIFWNMFEKKAKENTNLKKNEVKIEKWLFSQKFQFFGFLKKVDFLGDRTRRRSVKSEKFFKWLVALGQGYKPTCLFFQENAYTWRNRILKMAQNRKLTYPLFRKSLPINRLVGQKTPSKKKFPKMSFFGVFDPFPIFISKNKVV